MPVDAIVNLLRKLGWEREPDLTPAEGVAKPVFRRGEFKCVVGPLWTTHYRLIGDTMHDLDSTKTEDVAGVEAALEKLARPPVRPTGRRAPR